MFRLVLTNKQNGPKSGRFKELLGSYNPHSNEVQFDVERIKYWIENGAQVSDTVHNLLISQKIISGDKKNVLPKKTPIKKEGDTVENVQIAEEVTPAKEPVVDTAKEASTSAEAESESRPESVGEDTEKTEENAKKEVEQANLEVKEEKSPEEPNKEEPAVSEESKKEPAE